MLGIAALVVGLQILVLYTPLQSFLDLDALSPVDLAICAGLAVSLLAIIEAVKAVNRVRVVRLAQ
jgi:hypothetical protein